MKIFKFNGAFRCNMLELTAARLVMEGKGEFYEDSYKKVLKRIPKSEYCTFKDYAVPRAHDAYIHRALRPYVLSRCKNVAVQFCKSLLHIS